MRPLSDGLSIVPGQIALQRRLADEVGRHRLREPDHRRLRRPIGVAVGKAAHRGGAGSDIDDRAAALRQHAGGEGADRPMHRLHVDVERKIPVGVREVERSAVMDEARAVE